MVRWPLLVVVVAAAACGCTGLDVPVTGTTGPGQLPRTAGPPLPASQSHRTIALPFEGGYRRRLTILEASRSVPQGGHAVVVWLPGLGVASVACDARPEARFTLTSWAKGEGPPRLRTTTRSTHGRTSAFGLAWRRDPQAGLLARHIARSEAGRQLVTRLRFSGGGEAFGFTVHIGVLATATSRRCDVLAEARVFARGVLSRYAPGHRSY